MVQQANKALDEVFGALSDVTRRTMLRRLAEHEQTITDLARPFRMSFAAASKHVRVLERAGLVRRRIEGRSHVCRIVPAPLANADKWLSYYEHFWTDQLAALDAHLSAEDRAARSRNKKG